LLKIVSALVVHHPCILGGRRRRRLCVVRLGRLL
jgi:hypothetical protein